MSKAALALAAYQVIDRRAHRGYREAKHLIGTVFRRGWRPLIPWIAVWIFAGLGWRLVHGLPIPGVVELMGVLGPLTLPTMLAQWTRYRETISGVANATGLASNGANGFA